VQDEGLARNKMINFDTPFKKFHTGCSKRIVHRDRMSYFGYASNTLQQDSQNKILQFFKGKETS